MNLMHFVQKLYKIENKLFKMILWNFETDFV